MKTKVKVLCFCFAFVLGVAAQAGFVYDIHINSAENPSLSFGEADTLKSSPFPPYSGMFGVIDVCFAGPENAEEWYDRLAEDIKTSSVDNQWILVAKSNARLMFKKTEDSTMPTDLKIVYNDVKSGEKKTVTIINELSFSVKTGGVYTITRDDNADPAENPNQDNNQFVPKGESREVTITPTAFTPETINISFAAGLAVVAYDGEDLAARIPSITTADVDWTIKVVYAAGTVAYNWTVPYTELQITLTPNDTRDDGDLNITMTPSRSAKPVSTTLKFLDDQDDVKLTKVVDWILQTFGTLDFDQDGVISADDVMYLYNWVSLGTPTSADTWFTADMLSGYTENATPEKLNTALAYFQSNIDDLKFGGDVELTADDVMYLYNYVNLGCPVASDVWFVADMLSGYTENSTPEKLQNAQQVLQDYSEQ